MESVSVVIIVAIIVQFLVERLKAPIPEQARHWAVPLLALVLGELICVLGCIDVLAIAGVALAPAWVSYILSGIAVSGGSTAVNEFLKVLMESRAS